MQLSWYDGALNLDCIAFLPMQASRIRHIYTL
jgi:hypothetical protein